LLQTQERMHQESQRILNASKGFLEQLISAADPVKMLQANLNKVDDAFMYVLTAELDAAVDREQTERAEKLQLVHDAIMQEVAGQAPPEIQLLDHLMQAADRSEQERLLNENQQLLSRELLQVVDLLQDQLKASGQDDMGRRMGDLKGLIAARLVSISE
jgi:hypothetical protein